MLTDGGVDESPSFAPNGRMILYATEAGGRGILAAVSSDGRVKQRLTAEAGDVREPAWGPLQKGSELGREHDASRSRNKASRCRSITEYFNDTGTRDDASLASLRHCRIARRRAAADVKEDGAPVEIASRTPSSASRSQPRRPRHRPDKPIETEPVGGNPLKDPGNILSKRSVFFDYDSNVGQGRVQAAGDARTRSTCRRTAARKIASRATPTSAAAANTTSRSASAAPTR